MPCRPVSRMAKHDPKPCEWQRVPSLRRKDGNPDDVAQSVEPGTRRGMAPKQEWALNSRRRDTWYSQQGLVAMLNRPIPRMGSNGGQSDQGKRLPNLCGEEGNSCDITSSTAPETGCGVASYKERAPDAE